MNKVARVRVRVKEWKVPFPAIGVPTWYTPVHNPNYWEHMLYPYYQRPISGGLNGLVLWNNTA